MKKTSLLALLLFFGVLSVTGGTPAWKVPVYSLSAQEMPVSQALETFAVAQGVSVVMSEAARSGVPVSGAFLQLPAEEFLNRLTTISNLTWYYDGTAIYVYTAGETTSALVDLKYMNAGEVLAMIKDLGVEDGRFPIKTASDGRLLMISGPPRYVQLVQETIARADSLREQRTFTEVEVRVFRLKNTWADDVRFRVSGAEDALDITGIASLLEDLMNGSSGRRIQDRAEGKDGEGNGAPSDGNILQSETAIHFRPVIEPDNRLNAVVVRDVAIRMPMYEKLIAELDKPQKVVEITVTTFDMSRTDALDWQLSLKVSGNRSSEHTQVAGGQLTDVLTAPDALSSSGLAGAVSYLGKHFQLDASLNALKTGNEGRTVFRTMVLTLNNMAAEITDKQTFYAKVAGKEAVSFEKVSAGMNLTMRPRIVPSPSEGVAPVIWLTMELEDGGFEKVTVDEMPMSSTATLTTQAAVFNEESLLLAGYLRDVDQKASWGIPYLRDIPYIGWLFGGLSNNKETVQRMFVLTPRVIDLDVELLARQQAVRMRDQSLEDRIQEDLEQKDRERKLSQDEQNARREKLDAENKQQLKANKQAREDAEKAAKRTSEMEAEAADAVKAAEAVPAPQAGAADGTNVDGAAEKGDVK